MVKVSGEHSVDRTQTSSTSDTFWTDMMVKSSDASESLQPLCQTLKTMPIHQSTELLKRADAAGMTFMHNAAENQTLEGIRAIADLIYTLFIEQEEPEGEDVSALFAEFEEDELISVLGSKSENKKTVLDILADRDSKHAFVIFWEVIQHNIREDHLKHLITSNSLFTNTPATCQEVTTQCRDQLAIETYESLRTENPETRQTPFHQAFSPENFMAIAQSKFALLTTEQLSQLFSTIKTGDVLAALIACEDPDLLAYFYIHVLARLPSEPLFNVLNQPIRGGSHLVSCIAKNRKANFAIFCEKVLATLTPKHLSTLLTQEAHLAYSPFEFAKAEVMLQIAMFAKQSESLQFLEMLSNRLPLDVFNRLLRCGENFFAEEETATMIASITKEGQVAVVLYLLTSGKLNEENLSDITQFGAHRNKSLILQEILAQPKEKRETLLWQSLQQDTPLGRLFHYSEGLLGFDVFGFFRPSIHSGDLKAVLDALRSENPELAKLYVHVTQALEAEKDPEAALTLINTCLSHGRLKEDNATALRNLKNDSGQTLSDLVAAKKKPGLKEKSFTFFADAVQSTRTSGPTTVLVDADTSRERRTARRSDDVPSSTPTP